MGVVPPIDVSVEQYQTVLALLQRYLPETTAWVYGSRAKRTSKPHSDLDLVVFAEPGQHPQVGELREAFEESNLPFRVDLFVWDEVPKSFHKKIEAEHVILIEPEKQTAAHTWPKFRLSDCIEKNDASYSSIDAWPYINYLDTGSITENRIAELQHFSVVSDIVPSRAKRKAKQGDIVYSMVRPNQRHFGVLKNIPDNFLVSTGFFVFSGKYGVSDTDFIYWYLAQDSIVEYLQVIAEHSTSAYPAIRPSDIENLEIYLPPFPEQRAIARILGTLDDKIELNQKSNKTLEETAKAIFKSWFVDFDPVRAKVEGRPTGLPSEISDLFPDELVDSEIGEIPMGWNLLSIDDVCMSIYSGGTPSTKTPEFWTGENPWLSSGETKNKFILQTEKQISETAVDKSSTRHAQKFDTVIASAGQGKTRGQTSMLLLDAFVNQSVVVLRADTDKVSKAHLFFNLERRYEEFRRHSDSSSSRGSLTTTLLKKLPYIFPGVELTHRFSKVVRPMIDSIENRLTENVILVELRDTLLPKLISGELRIPDAEKFLEEADI